MGSLGVNDDVFDPAVHGHARSNGHGYGHNHQSFTHGSHPSAHAYHPPARASASPAPRYGAPQYIHHGGASGEPYSQQYEDESDIQPELTDKGTSDDLRYNEEREHADESLTRAYNPATGEQNTYDTVFTLSFELVLPKGVAGAKFTVTPEDLRSAIADNMSKQDAYWVREYPRHLLEHAYPRDHRVTLVDTPHRITSASSGHSLLLISDVDPLNNKRHYSQHWSKLSQRSTMVMLVHSGHEARSCAESRNDTYFHLDPLHCDHAYKAHATAVFRADSALDINEGYFLFRRGSIYDRHLQAVVMRMRRKSEEERRVIAALDHLEGYFNEAAQARKRKGIKMTPELKQLNLAEFRIIDDLSMTKYITPAVLQDAKGPPLAMFENGISFFLTTDRSSPAAIERWVRDGGDDQLVSAQTDHSALVEIDLAIICPLLPQGVATYQ